MLCLEPTQNLPYMSPTFTYIECEGEFLKHNRKENSFAVHLIAKFKKSSNDASIPYSQNSLDKYNNRIITRGLTEQLGAILAGVSQNMKRMHLCSH